MTWRLAGSEGYTPYGIGEMLTMREDQPPRVVVTKADQLIGMHLSLWQELRNGIPEALEGAAVIDELGITMSLGTPGHGLGRLTYNVKDIGYGWVTLERAK